jgi:hypothetical protein
MAVEGLPTSSVRNFQVQQPIKAQPITLPTSRYPAHERGCKEKPTYHTHECKSFRPGPVANRYVESNERGPVQSPTIPFFFNSWRVQKSGRRWHWAVTEAECPCGCGRMVAAASRQPSHPGSHIQLARRDEAAGAKCQCVQPGVRRWLRRRA